MTEKGSFVEKQTYLVKSGGKTKGTFNQMRLFFNIWISRGGYCKHKRKKEGKKTLMCASYFPSFFSVRRQTVFLAACTHTEPLTLLTYCEWVSVFVLFSTPRLWQRMSKIHPVSLFIDSPIRLFFFCVCEFSITVESGICFHVHRVRSECGHKRKDPRWTTGETRCTVCVTVTAYGWVCKCYEVYCCFFVRADS